MDNAERAIIRHANKLVRHEVAKLSPVAQNLMALLFSMWTKEPQEQTTIDLAFIKARLGLTHEGDSYLENVILKTGKEIVDKSFIAVQFEGGAVVGSLIYWFEVNRRTQQLEVSTTTAFMDLFRKLKDGYTEYDFLTFYKIDSKQAKNIYYLCRRNFKGQFTMEWAEFRLELGYKETANNRNVMMLVKKAVEYLLQHQYLKTCTMMPIYGSGRGRPLAQIHFEYTFPDVQPARKTIGSVNNAPAQLSNEVELPTEKINTECEADRIMQTNADTDESAPIPPGDIQPVTSEERRAAVLAALPKIEEVIIEQQKQQKKTEAELVSPEDAAKKLERFCPHCGTPMEIRRNTKTNAIFWACPRSGIMGECPQKTITLPAEIAEIYWKNARKKGDKE